MCIVLILLMCRFSFSVFNFISLHLIVTRSEKALYDKTDCCIYFPNLLYDKKENVPSRTESLNRISFSASLFTALIKY